jgi:hypothetical protein
MGEVNERQGRAKGGAGSSPRRSSDMGGSWVREHGLTKRGVPAMGVAVAGEGDGSDGQGPRERVREKAQRR